MIFYLCRRKFIYNILYCILLLCIVPSSIFAQQTSQSIDMQFLPSPSFEGRVGFWKLIFTKYGKEQRVAHYRSHPEIIYSILDFSEIAAKYSEKEYKRLRERMTKSEIARIQKALNNLASGKKPSSPFERRLDSIFADKFGQANKLEHFKDALTDNQIRFQTGIKELFGQGIKRSGRYLYAIEKILTNHGLPPEIGRLPLVESSFDYNAYSSKGAAGIWQFIRTTGRQYMRVHSSIDERRDPLVSTRAAAQYLSHSYSRLGTWPLAITSYNHGLNGVLRAVQETGSRNIEVIIKNYQGRTFGFASQNFYAEFLAALDIEKNASLYFPDIEPERPWLFDEIKLEAPVEYRTLVQYSGVDEGTFHNYNLSLLKPVRSGRVNIPQGFVLKVPKGHGTQLVANLQQGKSITISEGNKYFAANRKNVQNENRSSTHRYRVVPGDTIGKIARQYRVRERDLMSANNISDPRRLRAGQNIIIPATGSIIMASASNNPQYYIVVPGDNLTKIAGKHGISVSALQKLNPEAGNRIYPGQRLIVR
jgi:membrane-bound lytic murein transglycosylase D